MAAYLQPANPAPKKARLLAPTIEVDEPSNGAAQSSGQASAGAEGSLSTRLGLSDSRLEEGKQEAESIFELRVGAKKRPKMTHSLFFEDDKGMKKILRIFPNIKLQGKGREYEDVTLLLQHYKRWFAELYPYGEHFEDLTWRARQVLQDKEKEDDGTISDPRERLHAFRFQYKNAPPAAKTATGAHLSEEARARIEENRKRAMELKQKKEAAAAGLSSAAAGDPAQDADMEEIWRMEQEHAAAASKQRASGAPAFDFDDEEDPFGFGGGFDVEESAGASKPRAGAPAFGFDEEDDDVFGFGGGFDDEPERPCDPPKPAAVSEEKVSAAAMDQDAASRIAANRAKALARKAELAAAAATVDCTADSVAAAATTVDSTAASVAAAAAAVESSTAAVTAAKAEDPFALDAGEPFEYEDDVFDFGGGGFDDP